MLSLALLAHWHRRLSGFSTPEDPITIDVFNRFADSLSWQVVGLESVGWWPIVEDQFGSYEVTDADDELFHEPEGVGIKTGKLLGHGAGGRLPWVGGHESDTRLGRIKEITKHYPDGATFPEEPGGITTLDQVVGEGRRGIDYFGHWEPFDYGVFAKMIYWERPQGGQVFHGRYIAGGWALSVDPKLRTPMRDVLHRFGIEHQEA